MKPSIKVVLVELVALGWFLSLILSWIRQIIFIWFWFHSSYCLFLIIKVISDHHGKMKIMQKHSKIKSKIPSNPTAQT